MHPQNKEEEMKHIPIILFCLLSINGIAQNNTQQQKTLDEVVVTGQINTQTLKNTVHQIRVIGKDRIEKQGATNLQTVLKNELNISFSQDAATGGSDITLMGMKGQNVKILIDGIAMVGRQGTSNEININQIDINTVERIEIVEGPMAVVYGADALAGVINIITKKNKTKTLQIRAGVQEETVGNEYGKSKGIHNQNIGIDWKYKKVEIGGSFTHNYFGGWKDTAVERELVWHKKDQLMSSAYIGYRKNKFSVRYRFDGMDEIITNPSNYSVFPNQISGDFLANDQQYLSKRIMQQIQAGFSFSNNVNTQIQSSYTDYNRQIYSTILSKKTGKETLDGGTGRQSNVNFNGFTTRAIVNYTINDKIAIQPGLDLNTETGVGERLNAGKNTITDFAFFTTAEIKPTNKISIRPGVRFIKNSVYNAPPLVASLNTKFTLSKNIDLRLAFANGFRTPSIRELYFNFFDANHQIYGNPNLKAETSNSFNASLNFNTTTKKQININTSITGFYNKVKNLIDFAVSPTNSNDYLYTNIANSKTAGTYINNTVKYKQWNIAVGAAYTGFFNELSESDKSLPTFQWSPEVSSNIGYSFSKIGMDVNLFYKLNGRKPFYALNNSQVPVQVIQKGYQLADFIVNKKFKIVTLSTGVKNIFNIDRINSSIATGGVHSSNNSRSIASGRSFFIGINFNWNKK